MIYRRAFLRELCGDSYSRPNIATPFPYEFDSKKWDVATNGQCLVLVRIDDTAPAWPARSDSPDVSKALPKKYPTPRTVNLERLRDWCASTPPCEDCDATGWQVDDEDNTIACGVCERGYKCGFSLLFDAYVQRALLWRYLRPLSQPSVAHVSIAGDHDAILVQHPDDDWRVYCMPGRRLSGDTIEDPFT